MTSSSEPKDRWDKPITPTEKAWAIASLIALFLAVAFLIASFFNSEPWSYFSCAFAVAYVIIRWRLKIIEDCREPEKARRRTLARELIKLALIAPVITIFLVLASLVRGLIKGESAWASMGTGAVIAGLVIAAWLVATLLGRAARALFFQDLDRDRPAER